MLLTKLFALLALLFHSSPSPYHHADHRKPFLGPENAHRCYTDAQHNRKGHLVRDVLELILHRNTGSWTLISGLYTARTFHLGQAISLVELAQAQSVRGANLMRTMRRLGVLKCDIESCSFPSKSCGLLHHDIRDK